MPLFTPAVPAKQVTVRVSDGSTGNADVLSQLLGASFRQIGFPSLMFDSKFSHNLVIHKRVDRDGWRVENTGLNGGMHTFKIPCINTIRPGVNELWSTDPPLYPVIYKQLLEAFADRTSGPFQHPDFGLLNVKVAEYSVTLDPDFRGGPTLLVSVYETVDDGDTAALASDSPQSIAVDAAQYLDGVFLTLQPSPYTGTPAAISLSDFLKELGSIADEWNLFKMQWAAAIDRVSYQLGVLAEQFGDEPGFSDNTNRLISALHAIKANGLRSARRTSIYIVPKRAMLPQIAARVSAKGVRNDVRDLLKLNPQLAKSAFIEPTTAVVYYS
ncbi:MAG: hypothetical protein JWM74_180 [Myxococcaceae bacterium]|nr:hypothetical protein [Myxococcaceae bacterium]